MKEADGRDHREDENKPDRRENDLSGASSHRGSMEKREPPANPQMRRKQFDRFDAADLATG